MDVYGIIGIILTALLSVWGGFRFSLMKFLKAAKEFSDVIQTVNVAYENDKQFDATELREIVKQWNEFVVATGFKKLEQLKIKTSSKG